MSLHIRKLPENHPKLGKLYAHINDMARILESLVPSISHKTNTAWTTCGVHREALAPEVEEPEDVEGIKFRGVWKAQAYDKNDLVVVRGGLNAGAYIAIKDVPASQPPPAYPDMGEYWVNLLPPPVWL